MKQGNLQQKHVQWVSSYCIKLMSRTWHVIFRYFAGELLKTWRRRWFVLKDGKIFWFKSDIIGPVSHLETLYRPYKFLQISSAEYC
jgi:hypothetical protein